MTVISKTSLCRYAVAWYSGIFIDDDALDEFYKFGNNRYYLFLFQQYFYNIKN